MDEQQMSVKKALNKFRSLGLWGVFVIFMYSAVTLFFMPKIQDVLTLREDINAGQMELDDKIEYAQYLQRLEGEPIKLEGDIVNYALPSKNDVVSLIITYEGLGRQEGMVLAPLDISPGLISDEEDEQDSSAIKELTPSIEESDEESPEEDAETVVVSDAPANVKRAPKPPVSRLKDVVFLMSIVADERDTAIRFLQDVYGTRRVLSIDNMSWQINNEKKIAMKLSVRAYYYTDPSHVATAELVRSGMVNDGFIDELKNAVTYDQYVLDTVAVGKENLFGYSRIPEPAPTGTP